MVGLISGTIVSGPDYAQLAGMATTSFWGPCIRSTAGSWPTRRLPTRLGFRPAKPPPDRWRRNHGGTGFFLQLAFVTRTHGSPQGHQRGTRLLHHEGIGSVDAATVQPADHISVARLLREAGASKRHRPSLCKGAASAPNTAETHGEPDSLDLLGPVPRAGTCASRPTGGTQLWP